MLQCGISPDDIDIRYDGLTGYWFEFRNRNGKTVLDSRAASFPDGGIYRTSSSAAASAVDYAFRHRVAFDKLDNMKEIHSNIISKYKSVLDYCGKKLADIRLDAKNDSYDNKDRTVPTLKSYIETIVGGGQAPGEMDNVISEVKKDVDGDEEEEVVKELTEIKGQLTEMLEFISRNSGEWLKNDAASSTLNFVKTASVDQMDFLPELAAFYVDKACGVIGMKSPKILGMCDDEDGYSVYVVDESRKAVVHIGDDALFRGVTESSGPAPYTFRYYTDVMIPCMLAVGHLKPMDDGTVVLLAARTMASGADEYDALSCVDKKRRIVSFRPVNGVETKGCSYASSVREPLVAAVPISKKASTEQSLNDALKANAERIKAAGMVIVVKQGSEYEGMAGTVDGDKIEFYNTHIEFPVRIEMDNGLVTEVWMMDGDVRIYA